MSRVTTLPLPITIPRPIVTPEVIVTPLPIQQSSPIVTAPRCTPGVVLDRRCSQS